MPVIHLPPFFIGNSGPSPSPDELRRIVSTHQRDGDIPVADLVYCFRAFRFEPKDSRELTELKENFIRHNFYCEKFAHLVEHAREQLSMTPSLSIVCASEDVEYVLYLFKDELKLEAIDESRLMIFNSFNRALKSASANLRLISDYLCKNLGPLSGQSENQQHLSYLIFLLTKSLDLSQDEISSNPENYSDAFNACINIFDHSCNLLDSIDESSSAPMIHLLNGSFCLALQVLCHQGSTKESNIAAGHAIKKFCHDGRNKGKIRQIPFLTPEAFSSINHIFTNRILDPESSSMLIEDLMRFYDGDTKISERLKKFEENAEVLRPETGQTTETRADNPATAAPQTLATSGDRGQTAGGAEKESYREGSTEARKTYILQNIREREIIEGDIGAAHVDGIDELLREFIDGSDSDRNRIIQEIELGILPMLPDGTIIYPNRLVSFLCDEMPLNPARPHQDSDSSPKKVRTVEKVKSDIREIFRTDESGTNLIFSLLVEFTQGDDARKGEIIGMVGLDDNVRSRVDVDELMDYFLKIAEVIEENRRAVPRSSAQSATGTPANETHSHSHQRR